ncbi:MAG TPA: ADOP family duplicated permease, partial [Acidobacteriota bacterium]|nr:ADOP family duplicated permease [Acidobacteriota bacterium]
LLGKTIRLDQDAYSVIGILPPTFHFPIYAGPMTGFPEHIDFFQPLNGARSYEQPLIGEFDFTGIARLKPDVPQRTALAELNAVQARIAKLADEKVDLAAQLVPLEEVVIGPARRQLYFLLAAVGAVLLIGCINIANLLLARIPGRMREAAIRMALCAGPGQVFQQFLTESVILGILGSALGIWLAYCSLHSLVAAAPSSIPRLDEVRMDSRVLCFAMALSAFTGLLAGVMPAWRMARANPQEALKSGGGAARENLQTRRLREELVGVEVGLCTVLLLLAGLLTASLFRVLNVQTGFAADHVLAADVELPPRSYSKADARIQFYDQAVEKIRSLPGVASASWVSLLPFEGQGSVTGVSLPGVHDPADIGKADYRVVGPGYFRAMGIPILAGRDFTESDRTRHVVIVSNSLASQFWPGENPVGKTCVSLWGEAQNNEVIGVAGDIRQVRLEDPPLLMVYTPVLFAQAVPNGPQSASIVVRTKMDPLGAAPEVRQVIQRIDPEVPVVALRPMSDLVSESVSGRRFQMSLALVFALCALLLAVLGIFGVIAYSVEQRRPEIGIRMAIGAPKTQLRTMVLRQGMAPVLSGLTVGIVAAVFSGRLIAALLFRVSAFDPVATACVVIIVMTASLAACWIPARRATKVDPLVALRYE